MPPTGHRRTLLRPTLGALLALGVLGLGSAPVPAQKEKPDKKREYQVKAAFLYHFASYVTWPAAAQPAEGKPFRVGVIGKDRFGKALDAAFAKKTVGGHEVTVTRLGAWKDLEEPKEREQLKTFHILLVADQADTADVLKEIGAAPVLTVSDQPGFQRAGGCIELFVEKGKVRFAIEQQRLQARYLKASSKLLKLARKRTKEEK